MKYTILLLLFILTIASKLSNAQNIELINSGEVIKQSTMLYDSGKYKSALGLLNKISRSDTNYVWTLFRKAVACEADSQYTQAVKYCEEGLSLSEQREYEPDLFNTYGNTLNDMGQPEKALKVFETGMTKYPSYSLFPFNKGVVLMGLKRYAEAEQMFQKTLMINPYMYSAHYQLAITAINEGKIIPSFLSFVAYLLVNPEGKYFSRSINGLSQITKATDEVLEYKNKRSIQPSENYQAVEDIVLSKIALDNAYKPIIALDDPISRQIQAVFEKLEYKDDDKDFWIQYYLPYYKQIFNNGKFELFINHIFSNAKIASIQDFNKKKSKELDQFKDEAAAYFNKIRSSRELIFSKRDLVSLPFLYENGTLTGRGILTNQGKTLTGKWDFYYPAGNIKVKANFNEKGEREGDWQFYFYSGKLKALEHYKNGKLEGSVEYYQENGNLSSQENYVNGQANGVITSYNYAGNVKAIANYKLGKKDGVVKKFNSNGTLLSIDNYSEDILTGTSEEYYKNGRLKESTQYINGKAEGPYKNYFQNGALSVEGHSTKGNGDGEWKYYYESGKLKEKRNYVNDIEEGLHQEYFENGQLAVSCVMRKGKINGEENHYYKDGKLRSKYVYDNGVVKSTQYLDKAGAVLSSATLKNNAISVLSYNDRGIKLARFNYNQKGDLDGPDTLFYSSGKIDQINQYKEGILNGPSITYYLNGQKKSEINMKDGKDDGYYISYHTNGQKEAEGWMQDGANQGPWHYYDELGRLTTNCYYYNGDLDGYREDFTPDGHKTIEQKYFKGWLDRITQYDNAGNVIAVDSFPKGSGKFKLLYPSGKVHATTNYINGDFNGPYKTYYFDGSLESQFFYKKGALDSTYISYFFGGVKNTEGQYAAGGKTGIWKTYTEDGKLSTVSHYANDLLNGEKIYYFSNGNKDNVSLYKDDQLNGPVKKYDQDGALAYQINFEDNSALTYSYLNSDGKPVAEIPIDAKNGKLKAYFQNGKPSRETQYIAGVKTGPDVLYYANGNVRSTDTTSFDITNGVSKEYYANSKLKSEYYYKTDNPTGTAREFHENGNLKKELTLDNGVSHGPTKYYDENGKLTKTMVYYYGSLISVINEK